MLLSCRLFSSVLGLEIAQASSRKNKEIAAPSSCAGSMSCDMHRALRFIYASHRVDFGYWRALKPRNCGRVLLAYAVRI